MSENFEATITEKVKTYLGMEIEKRKGGTIFINQENYCKKVLETFGMTNANSVSTPMEPGWSSKDSPPCDALPYREIVSSLIYLQMVTRPDISFAIGIASRALDNPTEAHCNLVKRIMRYLQGTADMGLLFGRGRQLEVYSDADFAGDTETRKSTTGIVCVYAGGAVSWQSKKQQKLYTSVRLVRQKKWCGLCEC